MKNHSIKQIIKPDQLIPIFFLGYIGLLFAGKTDYIIWILLPLALLSGKIAQSIFNYTQQNIDKSQIISKRAGREAASGNISTWIFAFTFSGIFIFLSFIINNGLCYYISIFSVILMAAYQFLKNLRNSPNYNFGLFEALCPVFGFLAVKNKFEIIPFILGASIFCWKIGIQISNAIYEMQTDKIIKNYFINRMGIKKTRVISIIVFILSISLLISSGIITARGLAYWISLLCFIIIIIRQVFLLNYKDAEIAKKESSQINNFAMPVIFIGILIDIFFH